MEIDDNITEVSGISSVIQKKLKHLGISNIRDLLLYFPRRHIDFTKTAKIKDLRLKEVVTIRATIKTIGKKYSFKTRKSHTEALISDETGHLPVIWFNQGYIANMYKPGDEVVLSGKLEYYNKRQLVNPSHELFKEETLHTGRLVPMYKLPEGVYDKTFRKIINNCLPLAKKLDDLIPSNTQTEFNLPTIQKATNEWHFPDTEDDLKNARLRFAFEEALVQQTAAAIHQKQREKLQAPTIAADIDAIKGAISHLPFELTLGQKKSLWEIMQDLEKPNPMNRLLEGDVGSGKTLISFLAAGLTAQAGFEAALLAPTEVLAYQHYQNAVDFFKSTKKAFKKTPSVILLTSKLSFINGEKITRKEALEIIKDLKLGLIIGTHALLNLSDTFRNLGLVIIDEQHRFGVAQRAQLQKAKTKHAPHLLSMSATPIPRTLALTLFADLTVSTLTELPKGRQKIATHIIPEQKRADAYTFIRQQIKEGRQAYIVIPRIEGSESEIDGENIKSVKKEFERLKKDIFPDLKLDLLHGKMKSEEKTTTLEQFSLGASDILVSTSVIEIGVDVPNTTIMMIEEAEKFGLAQLHQLRGRVGRGQHKSYCLLFTETDNEASLERLNQFSKINDGFKLAEIDLETRGFGDLFGENQSGFNFKYGQYLTLKTLKMARTAALSLTSHSDFPTKHKGLYEAAEPLSKQIHLE